jgi:acyl-coenzyme A thioesterase PaaI-like protein
VPADDDGAPYDPELMAAVADLGNALRGLVDASVRTAAGVPELSDVAERVREVTARLAAVPRPPHQLPPLDDPIIFRRVYNPVSGVGSALAPPLDIRAEDGGVVAEATLGIAYEGPPGFLHGGMSGLLMDQVLGAAAISAGLWGMTVRLELDYRGPIPLDVPLVLRGRVVEDAGRKTIAEGTIARADAPDRALVEARGIFVAPRPERIADYFGAVRDASGNAAPPGRPTDATAVRRRGEA